MTTKTTEIVNARIESTMLGIEDHGIFTAYLHFRWAAYGCGFGGYRLDTPTGPHACAGLFIARVLEIVGVNKWEDLPGKYARIETEGWGGGIVRIGNIIEDKWFDPKAELSKGTK